MTSSSTPTSTMISIVVDTNQFLSGFIYNGMVKIVFDLILDNKLKLYISPALKTEVLEKLHKFKINNQAKNEVMYFMETRGILIKPTVKVKACRDPEDNFILELAQSSKANYIITRDKDLLDLPRKKWKSAKIMKPEEFLPILRKILPQRFN